MISVNAIIVFCVITYFALWGYSWYSYWRFAQSHDDIIKIEKKYQYSKLAKGWGWILSLLLLFLLNLILPEVYIIKKLPANDNYAEIKANIKSEVFQEWAEEHEQRCKFVNHSFFVPFYYNGHFCTPFSRYLLNDTDSELELYKVDYICGKFHSCLDCNVIKYPPGYFGKEFHTPYFFFQRPYDLIFYNKSKKTSDIYESKWALDLPEDAENNRKYIRAEALKGIYPTSDNYYNNKKSIQSVELEVPKPPEPIYAPQIDKKAKSTISKDVQRQININVDSMLKETRSIDTKAQQSHIADTAQ